MSNAARGFTVYNVPLHPSSCELTKPPRSAFSVICTAPLCAMHPITSPCLILSASTPLVAPNTYCARVTGALLNLPTHLPPRNPTSTRSPGIRADRYTQSCLSRRGPPLRAWVLASQVFAKARTSILHFGGGDACPRALLLIVCYTAACSCAPLGPSASFPAPLADSCRARRRRLVERDHRQGVHPALSISDADANAHLSILRASRKSWSWDGGGDRDEDGDGHRALVDLGGDVDAVRDWIKKPRCFSMSLAHAHGDGPGHMFFPSPSPSLSAPSSPSSRRLVLVSSSRHRVPHAHAGARVQCNGSEGGHLYARKEHEHPSSLMQKLMSCAHAHPDLDRTRVGVLAGAVFAQPPLYAYVHTKPRNGEAGMWSFHLQGPVPKLAMPILPHLSSSLSIALMFASYPDTYPPPHPALWYPFPAYLSIPYRVPSPSHPRARPPRLDYVDYIPSFNPSLTIAGGCIN
ncbi:hypothetical protein B0H13DRAFT_2356725 [Mycena leptocephala]|nr:hypothetical protein B0H13DRAFT_2356725 [Mycena leptocephala]